MIKIFVVKENEIIQSYKITGHAEFDTLGKDIVCAAVSSITITTINGILTLDNTAIKYVQDEEGLLIENIKKDNSTNLLLNNMDNLLHELSEDYPKNVKFI